MGSRSRQRLALGGLVLLVLLSGATPAVGTSGSAAAGADSIRLVRVLEPERTGVGAPVGLAASPNDTRLLVVGAGVPSAADVTVVDRFGRRAGVVRLGQGLQDPINIALDAHRHRLLLLTGEPGELLEVGEDAAGNLVPGTSRRHDAARLGLRDPGGMTVDPATGTVFFLDQGPRLLSVQPAADGSFAAASVSVVDLAAIGTPELRGLAFDPGSGHVYTRGGDRLYELSQYGAVVATRDLAGIGLADPQGIVVAPSGDQTDEPAQMSVYVADRGSARRSPSGQIVELSTAPIAAAEATSFEASLVRTTDMAAASFSPQSPDPSGLTYVSTANRLFMVDGEVEETVGGVTHFTGANLWEMTLAGGVLRTANISPVAPTVTPMTDEPTGITWNPATGHYHVTDDDAQRVYDLNPGADGLVGTADDSWTSFGTSGNGNGDPEGIALDTWNNRLFVADGVNTEIYQYTLAGTPAGHFDVGQYGVVDPESVEFNAATGTLLVLSNSGSRIIVETTTSGALLQTIDVSAANAAAPAGLAYAPASDGSGAKRFYVVARGIDNNSNNDIVDGKMFELTAPQPGTPGNAPPTVQAGPDQTITLADSAVLDGTVTDDGIPNPPGAVTATWSQVSGPGTVTFANASAVDTTATMSSLGTYVLRLTGSDSELSAFDDLTMTVTGPGGELPLDVRVDAGSDDAEESASGSVSLTSSDLELVFDGSNQTVGVRFNAVGIPQGATITNAYVQFQADEAQSEATALTIAGQAADNAATFTSTGGNVSTRPRTVATVSWSPPAWSTIGAAGPDQRTPNLAAVVQEIVSRAGWASGNSLVLLITGTGHRTAEAYESGANTAPLLHVEYTTTPGGTTAPAVTVTAPANGASFTQGTSVTFTGSASDVQDGNLTSSLTWTSSLDGPIGTGGSFSISSLSVGSHTVTAAVTDSGGLTGSAVVTVTITAPVVDFIFADGFESGSLAAWSSATTDGGSLSATAQAALVGAWGLQAVVNDNNPIYVTDETPAAEPRYRARFYFDPNSIAMASGNNHYVFQGLTSAGTVAVRVQFRRNSSGYGVRLSAVNDGTSYSTTSWVTIADQPHSIELDWQASSAAGANDGRATLWIDNNQVGAVIGVDNDTRRIERARLGAVSGIDSGTRGTEYFDAFESRRQTQIGP